MALNMSDPKPEESGTLDNSPGAGRALEPLPDPVGDILVLMQLPPGQCGTPSAPRMKTTPLPPVDEETPRSWDNHDQSAQWTDGASAQGTGVFVGLAAAKPEYIEYKVQRRSNINGTPADAFASSKMPSDGGKTPRNEGT